MNKLVLTIVLGCGLVAGCQPAPKPPPENVLAQGVAEALIDTGFYSEVAVTRIIGSHYNPSDATWKIFACFNFAAPSGQQGSNCMDSFQALRLDGGDWVVSATVDGVYRWRAINALGIEPARVTPPTQPPTTPTPAAPAAPAPAAPAPATPAPEVPASSEPQSGTSSLNRIESESLSPDQAR